MNVKILTPDEKLSLTRKPALSEVDRLKLNPEDFLIMCAGFEDRSLGVLNMVAREGTHFSVVAIHYDPFVQQNRADVTQEICSRIHAEMIPVIFKRQEPEGFGETVLNALSNCRGRIFIDISAMSRLMIVQLLVALHAQNVGLVNCTAVYCEAKSYPPTREEAQAELARAEADPTFSILFLSSGVFDITMMPELSSFAPASTQTRLVVFPSLDAHHLTALRSELQPARISFIEGVPPSPENAWRQGLIASANRIEQLEGAERWKTSTLDYRETLDCLLKIYAEHGIRERILVAPTGSKMQTLAVGIFRAFVSDVQIVYPTPIMFRKPEAYTVGVGKVYSLALSGFHSDI